MNISILEPLSIDIAANATTRQIADALNVAVRSGAGRIVVRPANDDVADLVELCVHQAGYGSLVTVADPSTS
jgi:hypothetical protein